MEEQRLLVFKTRMLRKIFELTRDEVIEAGENCIRGIFIINTIH
jgi:hypothetical protein